MARFTVDGIKNAASDDVLAIDPPEQWGLHGPIQTQWVERHVYWVLPLGTLFIFTLLALVFFWGFGGSFRGAWGTAFPQQVSRTWIPAQPQSSPVPVPAVSTPPAPVPAVPPQVTVNIPGNIQVDATVRNVTTPPSALHPEPSAEEKVNHFWDRKLNREP